MTWRLTDLRIVAPTSPADIQLRGQPLSLWRVALAAADETLQGNTMTTAWLRLFQTHLSRADASLLRWRGDLAESAEMRRAYSGMYGRYFARSLLASNLGITDFLSLRRNITTIPGGVRVRRILKGDIPDWIAWDGRNRSYVLAEAKGNLTGSYADYYSGIPPCIATGKAQFDRVEVRDTLNAIVVTRNWVAATLWSTDSRPRVPVSVLWDPPGQGDDISPDDAERHARAIRQRKLSALATRLSRSRTLGGLKQLLKVRITAEPRHESKMPDSIGIIAAESRERALPVESLARDRHSDVYVAALMTPFGVIPLRNAADAEVLMLAQQRATRFNELATIFGISLQSINSLEDRELWLSGNGIASPDGLSLFSLREVSVEMPTQDVA